MRCIHPAAFAAVACFTMGVAAAQPKAAPPTPTPPGPRFEPKIDDPMLAPLPAAATEVSTWSEAWKLLATSGTDLRRAAVAVARAEAARDIAGSALRPSARLSGAATIDLLHPDTAPGIPSLGTHDPTSPLGTAQLSARQALVDVGARRGRDAATADLRAASLERIDLERRSIQDVARALIAVASAERAAELNRVGLRQSLERAALGTRTYELGAATELDVVRTQQDVALARTALVAGDEQLQRAREALGIALGVDGAVGVADALTGDALLRELAAQCRPLAGELRADLAAAEADVAAARARRAEARAGYMPTVDLVTTLSAYTSADPVPAYLPTWTVALVLDLPLWEGGLRKAAIAERTAAETDAALVSADRRRTAGFEIARARRGGEVTGALVTTATEARALAERVDTMTRRSFEIGRATSLELVQSAAALRQAELTLSVREFERLAAEVDALLTEARCVP
jgi:outer membrane protein TolC